ncbi:sensor histidine kinase [Cyclobacterium qasimii]|uniref:histidine kinase n=1 Tax=Cyclobacterium qasimii TaxID=1350429 RepID=A0A512C9H3_9BACT|nr:HAMP domain-containing sensor histidine kinase [Cyclobacterium qasimii]GEO20852.1 two-component sensor histidine kinase [Cyclobacterium qasimii]
MNRTYKNRISFKLTMASALMILVSFILIYMVVKSTVLDNVDNNLENETNKHGNQIKIENGQIKFAHKGEWEEEEHNEINFNPIFIEIVDKEGKSMDKSPNLGTNNLNFKPGTTSENQGFNLTLNGQEIRQMQVELFTNNEFSGYLLLATSFEDSKLLLSNLSTILFILYPVVLLFLFLTLRRLASRSIQPIIDITKKAEIITKDNLNERLPSSRYKDEINSLSVSINHLLERVEKGVLREKQFTSDASHELRTPLAILKGNFEVLIRKPRPQEEYVEKIKDGIVIIDKLNAILDQLLTLARLQKNASVDEEVDLIFLVSDIVTSISEQYPNRSIQLENKIYEKLYINANEKSTAIIIENLVQNAIKYSPVEKTIKLILEQGTDGIHLYIVDQGIGISDADLAKIYQPFFRGGSHELGRINGAGLGLSIVKKLCDIYKINISIHSEKGKGTTIVLLFPPAILHS